MIRYRLNGSLSPMREEEEYGRNDVRIELMTIQEFEADKEQISHKKLLLRQLEQIQYCKAEIFGSCIIGTFAVPNVKNLPGKKESFGFHMVKDRLIFVEGGGEHVKSIFDRMREIQYGEQGSMSAFFTGFLNYLIEGDSIFLQGYENKLIVMEDKMTKGLQKNFYEKIIRCRKDMLHLQSFLTQLADMADIFRSNTNHLFEAEEKEGFAIFAHRVERLGDHVSLLREYIPVSYTHLQADVEIKGLMVSLNRMERGKGEKSALEEVRELYGFPTAAIVSMADVVEHLYNRECQGKIVIDDTLKAAIDAYYGQYGAK